VQRSQRFLKVCLCLLAFATAQAGLCAEASPKPAIDYSAPDFTALKAAFTKAMEAIQTTRTTALVSLIQINLENSEVMLKEKSKTRNVTGMAVANNAKLIFEGILTNLNATGTVKLPVKVRRELETVVAEFATAGKKIDGDFDTARTVLQKDFLDRFRALAVKSRPDWKGDVVADEMKQEFQSWAEGKYDPVPALQTDKTGGGDKPSGSVAGALPEVLGSFGTARKWATIAHGRGVAMSMDVVAIPLGQMKTGTNAVQNTNPITGSNSRVEYQALYKYPQRPAVPIRLKSCAGKEGVEVIEWPSGDNDYNLTIRLVSAKYPSSHAFDLQVGADEGAAAFLNPDAAPEFDSAEIMKSIPPLFLSVATAPPGASVVVDGELVKDIKSPCRVPIPVGMHSVELALTGYVPMILSNEMFTTNRSVKWKFLPDPRVLSKTLSLSADVNQWYPTGVIVQKDSMITIRAEGEWSCGAKGEHCSADGYPASVPTYRHYADPALRQVPGANYGAFLARIGKESAPVVVGQATKIKAADRGLLYFDINEVTGKTARSDNTGELTIKVTIMPPEVLAPGR